ncbi:sulfate transporter family-domain-containing protein [Mucor lusitanicus]|uniref:Sulfate transporter family-domain-containing protein n=1 Tax=Mucor circinelloides f. lusitanicus TaxID=29924 RepID=A0A8H4B931_MUCCL|nr:sulfate transporter family-domain-containing protein [Mucor lusitanicus]
MQRSQIWIHNTAYTVVSLLVGQAVTKVTEAHPDITGAEIAVCLSLFTGLTTMLIGLVRLGILVDFISEPVIAGYMTGSAITISFGQWPKVFGLKAVNTHESPYLIFYSFFKHLSETKLDAAFGLTALVALYIIKFGGAHLGQKVSKLKKPLFFLGIMRSGLIVILGTLVSYIINVHHHSKPLISIIQEVPAGFDAMAIPTLNMTILKEASGVLPSIVLILILEHVSVAKSFGRMSNYSINPNQEILAIGMSNIVGSFFGAYPCTGAFSRTAVMARSGAKTPMAGVFSGAVVVLALYALTPAFYYIPESVLGAVVIHAVIDLISGPAFLKDLWHQSVLEFMIFVIAVVITFFMDVETAIYISVGLSLLLMLLRLARPSVSSLGRVKLNPAYSNLSASSSSSTSKQKHAAHDIYGMDKTARYIFVDEKDAHFSGLLDPLPAGVVVIRLSNSILYPNANYITERMTELVKSRTRSGNEGDDSSQQEERPWNQPVASSKEDMLHRHALKPYLESIVLDFGSVDKLDATALHTLHAMQQSLDRYAGGKAVEWHFCQVTNQQVRQLLIEAGFGYLPEAEKESTKTPFYSAGSVPTMNSLCDPMGMMLVDSFDSSTLNATTASHQEYQESGSIALLPKDIFPAFHWDVEEAVYSICARRQSQRKHCQQLQSPSSITVTIY